MKKMIRSLAHKASQKFSRRMLLAGVAMSMAMPAMAQQGGLDRAENALTDLETWLMGIVPIICTIAFIGAGIMYMLRIGNLEIVGRIAVGAVIVGSASAFVGMFLG